MYDKYRILDLTAEQVDPPIFNPMKHELDPKTKCVLRRKPEVVDGVTLHQTAVTFGVTKLQVKNAGGNVNLAKHRRALDVAAHMTAFSTGTAVLANPLLWYVFHGNKLNQRSLGLEVEGTYPGILNPRKKEELFVGELLEAAKNGLAYLVEEGRKLGMPIRYIFAHRQSSMTRRGDPGEEIWKKLVEEFAIPTLKLSPQYMYTCGGRPVPKAWSDSGIGEF